MVAGREHGVGGGHLLVVYIASLVAMTELHKLERAIEKSGNDPLRLPDGHDLQVGHGISGLRSYVASFVKSILATILVRLFLSCCKIL